MTNLIRNPVSLIGAALGTTSLLTIIFLFFVNLVSAQPSPYVGILLFMVAPGFLLNIQYFQSRSFGMFDCVNRCQSEDVKQRWTSIHLVASKKSAQPKTITSGLLSNMLASWTTESSYTYSSKGHCSCTTPCF